jgi:hypothetical protein
VTYKYVYKITGGGASNFEQTVVDTVRKDRVIELKCKEANTRRTDSIKAYFIVTDKDGEKIYLSRKLTAKYRPGDFAFSSDTLVFPSDSVEKEVEVSSLNKEADAIECKIKTDDNWIIYDANKVFKVDADTKKFKVKFTITENKTGSGREAKFELVKSADGTSFNPKVELVIRQNQKFVPDYK